MKKEWYISRFEKKVNSHIRGIIESIKIPSFNKRDIFSGITKEYSYLNTAGIGPALTIALQETFRYNEFLSGLGMLSAEGLAHYELAPEIFKEYISGMLNCGPEEITFFENSSQAINVILNSIELNNKDIILTSDQEHPSGYLPLKRLSENIGISLFFIPCKKPVSFIKNFENIYRLSRDKIKLVFLSLASYSSGNILPIKDIISIIDRSKTLIFIDAAQYAGLHRIDLKDMDVDFLSFPGHKWYHAPLGTGVLYVNKKTRDKIRPSWVSYNSVVESDIESDIEYRRDAGCFMCGTWDISKFLGLTISMKIIEKYLPDIREFYEDTFKKVYNMVSDIPGLVVNTRPQLTTKGIIGFKHKSILPKLLEQEAYEKNKLIIKAISYPEKFPSVRISPGFIHGIEPQDNLFKFLRELEK